MLHTLADDFAAEVEQLCNTTVTDAQWTAFLNRQVHGVDTVTSQPLEGPALAISDRKREPLQRLYRTTLRLTLSRRRTRRPARREHPRAPRR